MKRSLPVGIFFVALTALDLSLSARAAEITAFEIVKDANRYMSNNVRDQVVQIYSEKSTGSFAPTSWSVVFHDSGATFGTSEVKYSNGRETEIKHLQRVFELVQSKNKPLDHKRLNLDSDDALAVATNDPALADLTFVSSLMSLDNSDAGPVWKVQLWAAREGRDAEAEIGSMQISADDGSVIKRELHPEKARAGKPRPEKKKRDKGRPDNDN